MNPLYTAAATATGGRSGRVLSADGVLDLPLTMPKGLGGSGEAGANPEQLFAAGYAACFGSALGMIARMQKVNLGSIQITARVTIGKDDTGFGLAVELVGHMPDLERAQAEALMAAAHQVCPYSRATRGNIPVTLTVAG
ncbi:MAG TPA: organic hydroperoxide resistance protein [Myxococcota bacterium]|nr:organic hydroperoxide resistance protein [Myxococcota bacterium]HNH48724.1 organic hydroperoxide resistance protein [Myxococcota bacterium]